MTLIPSPRARAALHENIYRTVHKRNGFVFFRGKFEALL